MERGRQVLMVATAAECDLVLDRPGGRSVAFALEREQGGVCVPSSHVRGPGTAAGRVGPCPRSSADEVTAMGVFSSEMLQALRGCRVARGRGLIRWHASLCELRGVARTRPPPCAGRLLVASVGKEVSGPRGVGSG